MKEELTLLLEKHGVNLFKYFLNQFKIGYHIHEDDTGIRVFFDYGESEDYTDEFIHTKNGFIRYVTTKSSIEPLLRDYKRFVNLKAFL